AFRQAASVRYSQTLQSANRRAQPRCGALTPNNRSRITAMHGKSSKFASAILSALLYTQGLFGVAGVTLVMVKEHVQVDAVLAMDAASPDAHLR
ncbi:MAG: hypothetical protein M3Y78_03820, partial [Pseudomonadota bacterium]|nr:hypothetical protein [Pseudomonadota bacterium]